jgi:hypothetical protein
MSDEITEFWEYFPIYIEPELLAKNKNDAVSKYIYEKYLGLND